MSIAIPRSSHECYLEPYNEKYPDSPHDRNYTSVICNHCGYRGTWINGVQAKRSAMQHEQSAGRYL